jgi:hypothetical protein
MKTYVMKTAEGGVVTLPKLIGIPYWLLAVLTILLTVFFMTRRRGRSKTQMKTGDALATRVLTRSWKPWVSGLAIGLLMVPAYLSSAASGRNYPLGVTHGVMHAELLLVDQNFQHVWTANPPTSVATESSTPPPAKRISWWLVFLVSSLVLGSWVSGRMSGQAKLRPKPPDEVVVALLGGVLVGVGAAIATGCVVGNIMSGWALMSVGGILFGVVTLLANWMTTYFYLMGGRKQA